MRSFSPTQQALNEALRQRLSAAGCRRGRLDVSRTEQLSLSGQKADGKTIFFWDFSRPFQTLVRQCVAESFPQGFAQLTVLADVETESYTYSITTAQQQAAAEAAAQQQATIDKRNRRRSRMPFGPTLAGQVADALVQGRKLAYSHRDYCGMGLIYRANAFCYGEIWDGDFIAKPQRAFHRREEFVGWLAQQSNYSLAGLENDDPWAWDNQTLTQQRLKEFVAGR
jgi:hypothetical protein